MFDPHRAHFYSDSLWENSKPFRMDMGLLFD